MFKRVIIPLDGSELAESILPFIIQIAGPLDIEVTLVRVLQPVPPEVVEGVGRVMIDDVGQRQAEAQTYLADLATSIGTSGVRVRTDVRIGVPVREIVECVRERDADLVAMTTHGRSGLGRLLFGSVAEAVLRQADVPVFFLRQTEKQARAARAMPPAQAVAR
jgi:nucleotide-binding universal stress UspA family protein